MNCERKKRKEKEKVKKRAGHDTKGQLESWRDLFKKKKLEREAVPLQGNRKPGFPKPWIHDECERAY
jgi:hypothetical protein